MRVDAAAAALVFVLFLLYCLYLVFSVPEWVHSSEWPGNCELTYNLSETGSTYLYEIANGTLVKRICGG